MRSANVVPRDQDRMIFFVDNYIDENQFNQLFDADWFNKSIRNADAMTHKLGLALIKVINLRLDVTKKKVQKKQEEVERQKTEAIAAKQQRDRGGISSSNQNNDNYYNNTNDTDLDQKNNFNPVQRHNGSEGAGDNTD